MESAKTGTYILPRAFPSSRMKWEGRAPNRELRDLPGQYTEGNKVLRQMELLQTTINILRRPVRPGARSAEPWTTLSGQRVAYMAEGGSSILANIRCLPPRA